MTDCPLPGARSPRSLACRPLLVLAITSLTFVSRICAAGEVPKPKNVLPAPASAMSAGESSDSTDATQVTGDDGRSETGPELPPAATSPVVAVSHSSLSTRPLVPLYVSYAALQALDVHSTLHAIGAGGAEGNGFMAPLVSRPAAFVALKAGVTAGIIYSSQRLAKRNRVGALVLMIAANSAYAVIVAHNYRVASRLK